MKLKLPVLFAMTAFVSSVAVAEYPKIIVHEHSLAYNYPGSKYELISHDESVINKEAAVDKTKYSNEDLNDQAKDTFFPKVRVGEHSFAYNYPGSKYELLTHGDSTDIMEADVDTNDEAGIDKELLADAQ